MRTFKHSDPTSLHHEMNIRSTCQVSLLHQHDLLVLLKSFTTKQVRLKISLNFYFSRVPSSLLRTLRLLSELKPESTGSLKLDEHPLAIPGMSQTYHLIGQNPSVAPTTTTPNNHHSTDGARSILVDLASKHMSNLRIHRNFLEDLNENIAFRQSLDNAQDLELQAMLHRTRVALDDAYVVTGMAVNSWTRPERETLHQTQPRQREAEARATAPAPEPSPAPQADTNQGTIPTESPLEAKTIKSNSKQRKKEKLRLLKEKHESKNPKKKKKEAALQKRWTFRSHVSGAQSYGPGVIPGIIPGNKKIFLDSEAVRPSMPDDIDAQNASAVTPDHQARERETSLPADIPSATDPGSSSDAAYEAEFVAEVRRLIAAKRAARKKRLEREDAIANGTLQGEKRKRDQQDGPSPSTAVKHAETPSTSATVTLRCKRPRWDAQDKSRDAMGRWVSESYEEDARDEARLERIKRAVRASQAMREPVQRLRVVGASPEQADLADRLVGKRRFEEVAGNARMGDGGTEGKRRRKSWGSWGEFAGG